MRNFEQVTNYDGVFTRNNTEVAALRSQLSQRCPEKLVSVAVTSQVTTLSPLVTLPAPSACSISLPFLHNFSVTAPPASKTTTSTAMVPSLGVYTAPTQKGKPFPTHDLRKRTMKLG